ncbi:hypothetical protein L208DRAFT_1379659 [Tricholoma matsutake]|nr:hypothetical protein L208DRAFT_1379659 [Tricholoma matsutake 945]
MTGGGLEKGKGERTMRSQVSHVHSVSRKQERAEKKQHLHSGDEFTHQLEMGKGEDCKGVLHWRGLPRGRKMELGRSWKEGCFIGLGMEPALETGYKVGYMVWSMFGAARQMAGIPGYTSR